MLYLKHMPDIIYIELHKREYTWRTNQIQYTVTHAHNKQSK